MSDADERYETLINRTPILKTTHIVPGQVVAMMKTMGKKPNAKEVEKAKSEERLSKLK